MNLPKKLERVDFSKLSRVKDSLLLRLKLRRRALNEDKLSLDDLNHVVAAGNPKAGFFKRFDV